MYNKGMSFLSGGQPHPDTALGRNSYSFTTFERTGALAP